MSMIPAQPGWFAFYDGGYEPVIAWGEAAANPNADAWAWALVHDGDGTLVAATLARGYHSVVFTEDPEGHTFDAETT
jgi:hypothetical protein